MQVNQTNGIKLILSMIAVSTLVVAGCRSGLPFGDLPKPDLAKIPRPDLGKLAFWKDKDTELESKDAPPPPARHFDPAPLGGTQVADASGSGSRNRFQNNPEQALSELNEAAGSASKPNGSGTKPIRKPYSTGLADSSAASNGNNFASGSGNKVRSKIEELEAVDAGLNRAQSDFQAALAGTQPSSQNDFAPPSGSSTKKPSVWKDDIKLPSGLSQIKNNVDNSFAAVNQSVKNAGNKIAENAKNAASNVNQVANEFRATVRNQFSPNNNFAPLQHPGAGGSGTKPNDPQVAGQVDQAKRQIEQFKSELGGSGTKPIPTDPALQGFAPNAPANRLAKLETPKYGSSYASKASFNSETTPQSSGGSSYPLTPHGQYNQLGSGQPTVPPKNNVSDVDIPESVLRGSGSYAPGSVNSLRPNK